MKVWIFLFGLCLLGCYAQPDVITFDTDTDTDTEARDTGGSDTEARDTGGSDTEALDTGGSDTEALDTDGTDTYVDAGAILSTEYLECVEEIKKYLVEWGFDLENDDPIILLDYPQEFWDGMTDCSEYAF